jgi:hypothetical protein
MEWRQCAQAHDPTQEQTMQQRQKATPTPSKSDSSAKSKSAKAAPVVLDEKALRHIAGGMSGTARGPNGGW